jgi:DegV family protein with EDD domain
MVKIVTDSTCDVPEAFAAQHGIGVAPATVDVNGVAHQDNVTITRADFYRQLPTLTAFPKTAAASPGAFADLYRAAGSDEVLSIHLSEKFSGMIRAARIAADDMKGENITVQTYDTHSLSLGTGWLVMRAAEMAAGGASRAEIVTELDAMRNRVKLFVMFDTLKNLRKGGRVSALTAGIGDLLQIRLLVDIHDDEFHQLDKVRTRARGLDRLIEAANSIGPCDQLAVLSAGSPAADVDALHTRLTAIVPRERQLSLEVGPALGAHTGIAAMGVSLVRST